jgi:hypothetical protein
VGHFPGEMQGGSFTSLIVVWKCPVRECQETIVTDYYFKETRGNSFYYEFKEFLNGTPILPVWPTFIKELKNGNPDEADKNERSKFREIYSQSAAAEFKGLNEIAGIGYRRAIEFLLKDYAIQEHPTEKDKIIKATLIQVIKDSFSTSTYLPLLERAAWLGNDETHYERKHPEFDVQDLKKVMWYIITDLDGKNQREQLIKTLLYKK